MQPQALRHIGARGEVRTIPDGHGESLARLLRCGKPVPRCRRNGTTGCFPAFQPDPQPWRSPMDRIVAGLPVLVSNTIIIGPAVVLSLAVHWIVQIILSRASLRTEVRRLGKEFGRQCRYLVYP